MRGRKKFFNDVSFNIVQRLYDGGMSTNEISKLFHVDPSTVQHEFKRRGVKIRSAVEGMRLALMQPQRGSHE